MVAAMRTGTSIAKMQIRAHLASRSEMQYMYKLTRSTIKSEIRMYCQVTNGNVHVLNIIRV